MLKINKNRVFSALHRSFGAVLGVFVVILAVTGLLLNHTSELGLKKVHLHNSLLNAVYGLNPPACTVAYPVGGHWLSLWGERQFWDGRPLDLPPTKRIYAALLKNDVVLVATAEQLNLLVTDGTLIDRIDYPAQHTLNRVGRYAGDLVLDFGSAWPHTKLNSDMTAFEPMQPSPEVVTWEAGGHALPEALAQAIRKTYQGEGVDLERVILDLHSGRIAGKIGVYFMDAVAIGMLLLVASGSFLLWLRRNSARKMAKRA